MKLKEILDAKRLQEQDDVGQIGALDFGQGGHKHLVFVLALCVQSETLAGTSTTGTTRSLIGVGLTDRVDLQCVHTNARIVNFQLAEASVHDEHDTVHGQRRFCDVGSHDALKQTLVSLIFTYKKSKIEKNGMFHRLKR